MLLIMFIVDIFDNRVAFLTYLRVSYLVEQDGIVEVRVHRVLEVVESPLTNSQRGISVYQRRISTVTTAATAATTVTTPATTATATTFDAVTTAT